MSEPTGPAGPRDDTTLIAPTTGLALHYRDWGGAGRPILLLHGLASSARIWDFVAPLLRDRGRVVALDARGHGASAKPDTGYDYASIIADVAGAGQAPHPAPPPVVGPSWGGSGGPAHPAHEPARPRGGALD